MSPSYETSIHPHGVLGRIAGCQAKIVVVLAIHDRSVDDASPIRGRDEICGHDGPCLCVALSINCAREKRIVVQSRQIRSLHFFQDFDFVSEHMAHQILSEYQLIAHFSKTSALPLCRWLLSDPDSDIIYIWADCEAYVPGKCPRGCSPCNYACWIINQVKFDKNCWLGHLFVSESHLMTRV